METSIDWNVALFHILNAAQQPNPPILWAVTFLAQYIPHLALVTLALVWFIGGPVRRRSLMVAAIALGIGLAVNFAFSVAVYVPRPFESGVGNTFLAHAPETSFPSDHATFLWSLGLGLLIAPALRQMGFLILLLGTVTAWARIFLGVHYPLDMLGSFVISLIAAIGALAFRVSLDRRLFPLVENSYMSAKYQILQLFPTRKG